MKSFEMAKIPQILDILNVTVFWRHIENNLNLSLFICAVKTATSKMFMSAQKYQIENFDPLDLLDASGSCKAF